MALLAATLNAALQPSVREAFRKVTQYGIIPDNFLLSDGSNLDSDAYDEAMGEAAARADDIAFELTQVIAEQIQLWIVSGAVVNSVIVAGTIATAGTPTAQIGPATSVPIIGTVA